MPKISETLIVGKSKVIFGGKGVNQAVASMLAGADLKFISQMRNDTFVENLKTYFKKLHFDEKYILTDENINLGIAHILVSKRGENSIAVSSGSNGTLTFKNTQLFLN